MKTYSRFIQNVEHSFQAATNLRCQTDSLGFASTQRIAGAVQADVSQAHRLQEVQSPDNFSKERFCNGALALGIFLAVKIHLGKPIPSIVDAHVMNIHNVLTSDADCKIFRLQAFPVTAGARLCSILLTILQVTETQTSLAGAPVSIKAEELWIEGTIHIPAAFRTARLFAGG